MLLKKKSSTVDGTNRRGVENSAKTLLANIRFMSVDSPIRTVVVTSTIPNEGKTFIAANLARAMATSGVRTLIVESDLRRRSQARTLGVHAEHGVYSVLVGEVPLKDAVVHTKTPRLDFLDAEPHIPNPSDLLSSNRYTRFIEQAKQEYGYIVFDTPPVGAFVDAAVLGAKVDAVFLVVREQFARKDDIARAADQLRAANVPLAGIVMNYCERDKGNYYYGYYYYQEEGKYSTANAPSLPANIAIEDAPQSSKAADKTGEQHGHQRNWSNAPDLDALDESDATIAFAAPNASNARNATSTAQAQAPNAPAKPAARNASNASSTAQDQASNAPAKPATSNASNAASERKRVDSASASKQRDAPSVTAASNAASTAQALNAPVKSDGTSERKRTESPVAPARSNGTNTAESKREGAPNGTAAPNVPSTSVASADAKRTNKSQTSGSGNKTSDQRDAFSWSYTSPNAPSEADGKADEQRNASDSAERDVLDVPVVPRRSNVSQPSEAEGKTGNQRNMSDTPDDDVLDVPVVPKRKKRGGRSRRRR